MAPRFAFVPARWLAPDSGLSASDRLTLCVLCQWVNKESGECFPSVSTIAAYAAMSENSVRAAVKRLVGLGAIQVERRKDKEGDSASNLYTVLGYDPVPKKLQLGTAIIAVPPSAIAVPVLQPLQDGTANRAFEVPQPLHPNVVTETKSVDVPASASADPDGPPRSRRLTTHEATHAPDAAVDWRAALSAVGVPENHLTDEGKFA